ncbi:MAG: hypothetical protein ACQEWV_22585 [Bacillota bacterium]
MDWRNGFLILRRFLDFFVFYALSEVIMRFEIWFRHECCPRFVFGCLNDFYILHMVRDFSFKSRIKSRFWFIMITFILLDLTEFNVISGPIARYFGLATAFAAWYASAVGILILYTDEIFCLLISLKGRCNKQNV